MQDFFMMGYENAKSIIDGPDGVQLEMDTENLTFDDILRFVEGAIQLFNDRSRTMKGIRASNPFHANLKNTQDFDGARNAYKGVPIAFGSSFFPKERIEIVAGPLSASN